MSRRGRGDGGGGGWRARFPRAAEGVARVGRLLDTARHALAHGALSAALRAGRAIRHVSGPEPPRPKPTEAVVTCLVRDGAPWLDAFLDHHRGLGARHFVFLDNGSTDGTVDRLRDEADATVFATDLPYRHFKVPLKRWLVERFGAGGWCLQADVDELFEYPFAESIPLSAFLGYLNERCYDVVVAYMLDMFGRESLERIQGRAEEDLRAAYPWFERASMRRDPAPAWQEAVTLSLESMPSYVGGVRSRVFGLRGSLLTKHALIRPGPDVRPFRFSDHFVAGARVADVAGVIRHYKFVSSLFRQMREAICEGQYYGGSKKYRRFDEVLEARDGLCLWTPAAERYTGAGTLLEDGWLPASPEFRRWAMGRGAPTGG